MIEALPCPLCGGAAPRRINLLKTAWYCKCTGINIQVSYDTGTVFSAVGEFIIIGNRTNCTFKRMGHEVQGIEADIRDILRLDAKTIEIIWKTNSWHKLSKVSSFL